MKTTIKDELDRNGSVIFKTKGHSMEPLIYEDKTFVCVEKVKEPIEKWDVILYGKKVEKKSIDVEYTLHRVVGFTKKGKLKLCGDNLISQEIIPKKAVIGVMTGFYNDGHFVDCKEDKHYRSYIKKLKIKYFLRVCKTSVRSFLRAIRGINE